MSASDDKARREAEAQEWYERALRREVACQDLNPAPMPPPPADGKCPRVSEWKASCKSRACAVCGPRWAQRQQVKMASNLEFYGGKVATLAVTGPGAKVLPWDEDYCRARNGSREHRHSGLRGCRVQQRPLREWCEALPLNWTRLRDSAQLQTKRKTGERAWIMERVWEPQKRGVPHLHLVIPYGDFQEMRVANVFRHALKVRAPKHGFGRVQGKLKAITGEDAARYLASYLTGRTRKRRKSSIRENIADPRLPKSLLWETPVLSSVSRKPRMVAMRERRGIKLGTGITMRTLRRVAHLHACFRGVCDFYPRWAGAEEAVVVAAVFRRTNPERAGPLGDFAGALDFARQLDAQATRDGGWLEQYNADTRRVEKPEELCRELTRIAFDVTRVAA